MLLLKCTDSFSVDGTDIWLTEDNPMFTKGEVFESWNQVMNRIITKPDSYNSILFRVWKYFTQIIRTE